MTEENVEVVRQFLATFIEVDEALIEADRLEEDYAPAATITLPEPMGRELHVDRFIEFRLRNLIADRFQHRRKSELLERREAAVNASAKHQEAAA